MKKIQTTIAILFIALFSISCSSSDDSPAQVAPVPAANYFLKAKINDVQYQTDAPFRVSTSRSTDRITIGSNLADGRNFELVIDRPTGTGTYSVPLPAGTNYGMALRYGDASSSSAIWSVGVCSGTTGTLTITALSATEISGTFTFTAKRTGGCAVAPISITEGSFKSGIIQ